VSVLNCQLPPSTPLPDDIVACLKSNFDFVRNNGHYIYRHHHTGRLVTISASASDTNATWRVRRDLRESAQPAADYEALRRKRAAQERLNWRRSKRIPLHRRGEQRGTRQRKQE